MPLLCRARLHSAEECSIAAAIEFLAKFHEQSSDCSADIDEQVSLTLAALRDLSGLPENAGRIAILKGESAPAMLKKRKKARVPDQEPRASQANGLEHEDKRKNNKKRGVMEKESKRKGWG